jgi:hypothetical protein
MKTRRRALARATRAAAQTACATHCGVLDVGTPSRNSANGEDYAGKLFAMGPVHKLSRRRSPYATPQVDKTGRFLIRGGSAIMAGQDSSGLAAGIQHYWF